MPADVAILGCGRSGTSIFGELFEALPGYTYFSEPYLAALPARPTGAVAVKVPRTPAGVTPPPGCSVEIATLTSALRDPVVFWQVRHPLDAICSLRVGIAEEWGHHPRPPDWEQWLDRPLLERCAHHWATINGAGFRHVAALAIVNRFEEMLRDPVACATSAATAVGADADASSIAAWADRVQDTDNERFVEAVTSRRHSRPDHERRIGRWRENLTWAEVESVLPLVADGAATFGYRLPDSPGEVTGERGTVG